LDVLLSLKPVEVGELGETGEDEEDGDDSGWGDLETDVHAQLAGGCAEEVVAGLVGRDDHRDDAHCEDWDRDEADKDELYASQNTSHVE